MPRGKKITSEQVEVIKKYAMIKTTHEIAALTGLTSGGVGNFLRKNNIPRKGQINSFDESFFEKIEREEQAYWLGFLYADGYVKKTRSKDQQCFGITLSARDKEHLEKFKVSLSASHPIKIYSRLGKKDYCRIEFYNDKVSGDLIRLGCVENKTLILDFPSGEQVPKELINHFLRGYFDGDGCLSFWQKEKSSYLKFSFSVLGTQEFLKGFQKTLKMSFQFSQRFPERKKNNYTLSICGNQQIIKVCDFLYRDATIYLERKYEKYVLLKNKYG